MQTKELLKQIGTLAKTIFKMVSTIQTLAIECVLHAVQHGNVTPATQLVDACGKGIRRASLVAWFEHNGPFKWNAEKSAFGLDAERAKKMREIAEPELRESLADKKWEDAKPEPKIESIFDVEQQFDAFLRKVHKIMKDGKMELRNKELLATLERAGQQWHDLKTLERIRAAEGQELAIAYPEIVKAPTPNAPVPELLHMVTQ